MQEEGNYLIYDDTYNNTPLERLFLDHSPESVKQVKKMLDDSCYIGRHNVIQLYKHGHRTYNLRVNVELLESKFWYVWPYGGWYSMKDKRLEYKRGPKMFDSFITTAIRKGVHYMSANPYAIYGHMNVSVDKLTKALNALEPTGVIKSGEFRLSRYAEKEVNEFIDNIIKIK